MGPDTCKVVRVEFDSDDETIWKITVVRPSPGVIVSAWPRAEDLPQDALEALRAWADGGIPKDGPDPREKTLVASEGEAFLHDSDDDRCRASSWRGNVLHPVQKPKYRHLYGPGGYNRCVHGSGHPDVIGTVPNSHVDEWGNLFRLTPDGNDFRVIQRASQFGLTADE